MTKHIHKTLKLGFLLIFIGCRPQIQTTSNQTLMKQLVDEDEVMVFSLEQPIPEGSKFLGKIKIGGEIDTLCGYEQLIGEAKKHARKEGGNIIKITGIITALGLIDACDDIKVDIYFHEHIGDLAFAQNLVQDSITKSKFKGSPTFAILYVYRPAKHASSLLSYDIHINDSIICRAKNNSRYEIKIYKEGKMVIGAKKKPRYDKIFDIKLGEEYFLKCEVVPDFKRMANKPDINLIDKSRGRIEYEAVKE